MIIHYQCVIMKPVGETGYEISTVTRKFDLEGHGYSVLDFYKTVNAWNRALFYNFTKSAPDGKRRPLYLYTVLS